MPTISLPPHKQTVSLQCAISDCTVTCSCIVQIGSDKSHLYYRIPVTLNVVDYYRTSPLAPALALTQAAASGPVLAGLFTEDIEVS